MSYVQLFLAAPWMVRVVAAILALFVVLFVALFVAPGLVAWYRYDRLVLRIRAFKKSQRGNPAALFAGDGRLAHIWAEYEKTLHRQRELDAASGRYTVVALRATVPAAGIFTQEALVDSRIRTEFFKHLPGLCTGLGIIGTFAGLIDGLRAFHVADDPTVVRDSLELLLHGVFQAFLVSAAAITLAMLVTFVERLVVTALYREVEDITFELDSSFEGGVGEEYLERLVNASEGSADRAEALKAALVSDLRAALTEVSERQVRAQAESHRELARELTAALREELIGPIWRLASGTEAGAHDGAASGASAASADALRGLADELRGVAAEIGASVRTLTAALGEYGAQARQARAAADSDQAGLQARLAALSDAVQRGLDARPAADHASLAPLASAASIIQAAAADFGRATQRVGAVMDGSATLAERLAEAARSISSSVSALQAVVRDHAGSRDAVASTVRELRASLEQARRQSSLGDDALARIEAAAQSLGRASLDVEAFLDRVGEVLSTSHQAFVGSLQKTVDSVYDDFYRKLSHATQLLTDGVAELASAIDSPGRRP